MYVLNVKQFFDLWWKFLRTIEAAVPNIADSNRLTQIEIINSFLLRYNADCITAPNTSGEILVRFQAEEDYVIFKLRFA